MSVTTISLTTPEGMRLPASYIESAAEEAVVVSLTNSIISVDTESIMKYENYKFAKRDIASDQRTLIPLEKVLAEKYSKRQEIYVGLEDVKAENIPAPKLLIQADKELPFGTMKYLLHTVAKVGYTDYQFIVLPKE
jgi:biopolymer transport protein ExbD